MVSQKPYNKNNSRKPFIVVLVILLLIGGLALGYLYVRSHAQPKASQPTAAQQKTAEGKANADAKQKFIESQSTTPTTTPAAITPPVASPIDLSAKVETNNTVTIFTKLYGISDGKCNLSVTNAAKSYSDTATVIFQPEYSSCAGFSVPISRLGSGQWSVSLTVVPTSGPSESKVITVSVN